MNELGSISIGRGNPFGKVQEMRDQLLANVDTDQNGRLSFEEIEATDRGAQFADKLRAFDIDGSDDLSIEELTKMQEQIAEKIREKVQATVSPSDMPEALFEALYSDKDE